MWHHFDDAYRSVSVPKHLLLASGIKVGERWEENLPPRPPKRTPSIAHYIAIKDEALRRGTVTDSHLFLSREDGEEGDGGAACHEGVGAQLK